MNDGTLIGETVRQFSSEETIFYILSQFEPAVNLLPKGGVGHKDVHQPVQRGQSVIGKLHNR